MAYVGMPVSDDMMRMDQQGPVAGLVHHAVRRMGLQEIESEHRVEPHMGLQRA